MSNWYVFLFIMFVALLFLICVLLLITRKKKKSFIPSCDMAKSFGNINTVLASTGFFYSKIDDVFYSRKDAWQRDYGYCHLYDETLPLVGMIVDCEPITFDYDNKHWVIELRKGQYGMATGGEIGIYNTTNESIKAPGFHGIFYDSISNEECIPFEFKLKRNKKVLIHKRSTNWWLAGLKFAEFSNTTSLSLDAKFVFPNKKIRDAFVSGLLNVGYTTREFFVFFHQVNVHFTKPHILQPASRTRVQEFIIQQCNQKTCDTYQNLTSSYDNTLDKLDFLTNSSPELFDKFIKSFHPHEIYAGHELMKPILKKFNLSNQPTKIDDLSTNNLDI